MMRFAHFDIGIMVAKEELESTHTLPRTTLLYAHIIVVVESTPPISRIIPHRPFRIHLVLPPPPPGTLWCCQNRFPSLSSLAFSLGEFGDICVDLLTRRPGKRMTTKYIVPPQAVP